MSVTETPTVSDRSHHEKIAALNDAMRRSIMIGLLRGRVTITAGVRDLLGSWLLDPGAVTSMKALLQAVAEHDDFPRGDNPYGERDFAPFEYLGEQLFWKIDYHDATLTSGSKDPSDPTITTRVLTIMLRSEY